MRCLVFVHENELRIHDTTKKRNVRGKNISTIASAINSLDNVEDSMVTKHAAFLMRTLPLLNKPLSMILERWIRNIGLSCFYLFITACQTSMSLIRNEHWIPLLICSVQCCLHYRKRRLRSTSFNDTHHTGIRANKTPFYKMLATVKRVISPQVLRCVYFTISPSTCSLSHLA